MKNAENDDFLCICVVLLHLLGKLYSYTVSYHLLKKYKSHSFYKNNFNLKP